MHRCWIVGAAANRLNVLKCKRCGGGYLKSSLNISNEVYRTATLLLFSHHFNKILFLFCVILFNSDFLLLSICYNRFTAPHPHQLDSIQLILQRHLGTSSLDSYKFPATITIRSPPLLLLRALLVLLMHNNIRQAPKQR